MINSKKKTKHSEDNEVICNIEESNHVLEDNKQNFVNNRTTTVLTDDDILSNSFLFLLGGYEMSAILLSHLTYCLATNPECQQRLLEEVQQSMDENGNIDYETIVRLPYLDACVSETLRLYNPTLLTTRLASEDYKLGETGITIPKGMIVHIPIHAIHHSSKYYPNPHLFDPNRFMPENRDKLIPYTYLPFGVGPRNCVAIRFVLMETKSAITKLVLKYKFIRTKNTKIPLKSKRFALQMSPTDITLGIQLRNVK